MFETKRLFFRSADPGKDLNSLIKSFNDFELNQVLSSGPRVPKTKELAKKALAGESILPVFTVCLKPTDPGNKWPNNLGPDDDYFELAPPGIGFISFMAKEQWSYKNRVAYIALAIWDHKNRGKGYGLEILQWALEYAFMELGLHKVALEVFSNNPNAQRLYEKAGFVVEGRLRKIYYAAGQWHDATYMGVLEEEWFERRKKMTAEKSS